MKYFTSSMTLDEGKALYKKLMKENHPDLGGNEEICKEVNKQFDSFLNTKMQFGFDSAKDTKDHNVNTFADILKKAMKFNCRIEIIGFWIYAFDSYGCREDLKALGFFFSMKHKAWIFNGTGRKPIKSRFTTNQNRKMWGSQLMREKETAKEIE